MLRTCVCVPFNSFLISDLWVASFHKLIQNSDGHVLFVIDYRELAKLVFVLSLP